MKTICGWCYEKKKNVLGKWIRLSKKDNPDKFDSHGMCPECYDKFIKDLEKYERDGK